MMVGKTARVSRGRAGGQEIGSGPFTDSQFPLRALSASGPRSQISESEPTAFGITIGGLDSLRSDGSAMSAGRGELRAL